MWVSSRPIVRAGVDGKAGYIKLVPSDVPNTVVLHTGGLQFLFCFWLRRNTELWLFDFLDEASDCERGRVC